MITTNVLIGQILIVFAIVIGGFWFATQWTTDALGYQLRLGAPWLVVAGLPVYYPWRLLEWWYANDAYAPKVFETGGTIAASSGLLAAVGAIAGSIWRARQSRLVTTYGSAKWATPKQATAAGLTQPAGPFLGRLETPTGRRYLRHDGPEHIMAFAPTRSGKGAGLVVPTLLTWPESVLITESQTLASKRLLRMHPALSVKLRLFASPTLEATATTSCPKSDSIRRSRRRPRRSSQAVRSRDQSAYPTIIKPAMIVATLSQGPQEAWLCA